MKRSEAKKRTKQSDRLRECTSVMLENGKYEFVVQHNGVVSCYRHGEPWIEQFGEGSKALIALIHAAASDQSKPSGLATRDPNVAEKTMTLTVSYPTQTFFPIKYNGFELGGLSLTAEVHPGESIQVVYDAMWAQLEVMAVKQFAATFADYQERVRHAAEAMRK